MSPASSPGPFKRRVLLIDDRRDAVLAVRKLLELSGHQVSVAEDGRSGFELARQMNPEVILCDIGLPGELSGFDVAVAIRADPTCHGVYMVAVSGYGEPEHLRRSKQSGFDNHVVKPVSKATLDELMTAMPRFPGGEGPPIRDFT
jgi:CheY-like chemotaxis protein